MSNFDRLNADDRPSRAELSADAHEEGIEAATRAVYQLMVDGDDTDRSVAVAAIDAYLEVLNAH